jgi:thiamine pyrophosphokinase
VRLQAALLVLQGAKRAELARASALAGVLSDRCVLIAVDGGLKTCRSAGRRPDLFVGDGDSSRRVPAGLPAVIFPKDKDFSDFAGALQEAAHRDVELVVVAGLLGGRVDHEWANVQELGAHAKRFAAIVAPTARGTILVTSRGCDAITVPRRTFSLLVLGAQAQVSLRGVRWPVRRRNLRMGATGLSNITGSELRLRVHRGAVALVFPSLR